MNKAILKAVAVANFVKARDDKLRIRYPNAAPRFHISTARQFLESAVALNQEVEEISAILPTTDRDEIIAAVRLHGTRFVYDWASRWGEIPKAGVDAAS
ncbi:hypothetical protein KC887_01310 [Candidatus Kaiserbacteria bacterium]|nr:hypothetical protein [Candidatus Kaiserbacteria bacterium]